MANGKQKIWVSDIIGNDYKTWKDEVILLGSGTGRGKTTFSLEYCSWLILNGKDNILYLCNRKKLREQTQKIAEKKHLRDHITVISYHQLQDILKTGDTIDQYDAYICDEAHYFLADSSFNLYTDISYEYLMSQKESVVIFMTATYQNIFRKIRADIKDNCKKENLEYKEPKTYILATDYGYVDKIYWFRKEDLFGIVDRILRETDDKIIYFCNGITRMESFYNHYSPTYGTDEIEKYNQETSLKYMDFLCSDYSTHRWAKKHSNENAIVQGEKGGYQFQNRMLVSTKCIDNGVDFKDKKIKHIICDIFDLESAIQCLGRKRILDADDTCTFYIRDWQHNEATLFYSKTRNEVETADLFLKNRKEWENKYGKKRPYSDKSIYYDFDDTREWVLNELRYVKLKLDEILIKQMIEETTSYKAEILNLLGESAIEKSVDMSEVEADRTKNIIEIFIEKNVDVLLDKEQQEELVDICKVEDRFHRPQKSISQICAYLDSNYGYKVVSRSKEKRINGKRKKITYWMIKKSK